MMFSEIVQKEAQEMREEGIEEGQMKKAFETAKNMLARNLDSQLVSDCTGLPLEQVLELQKELQPVKA